MSSGKIIGSIIGILIICIAWYVWYIFNYGELSEKRAWIAIQSAMIQYKHTSDIQTPMIIRDHRGTNYILLALSNDNPDYPITWIILNEAAPVSGIYTLPIKGEFRVSCEYVSKIKLEMKINSSVLSFLESKCI